MLTLILLGAFHVHLQCVLLKQSFGEVEEAADPADVLALLRVLRLAVLDEGSGAPCWFPTENTDESLSVSPLMSYQALQIIMIVRWSGKHLHKKSTVQTVFVQIAFQPPPLKQMDALWELFFGSF